MERIDDKPSCISCRKLNEIYGKEPDCLDCIPVLMQENADAIKIYLLVRDQVIVAGLGQVVGINHLAVWEAIDRFKIENPVDCFEKVRMVFYHMLEKKYLESE